MAGYHFVIKNAGHTEDLGAMEFADHASAVAFGNGVIRDLMPRAAKSCTWCTMEITEGERIGGGMDSNHRLVLFTHALCRLSYPAVES
jgi:hypothetical protein